ncbi:hypothetical protein CDD82_1487 [Ophiocordyceps australis]|uniref:Zinc knuckle-domain-containing protein n=1 Tax=Ophiocordyceps australis TaxID=1399860 RepID=A0A2C5XYT3_9HYPO|nr:hypothetical protein CDD82_1487 [Ophiocordyceps australis]
MYSHRSRGRPTRSTPANVQCQKCLKRGHYSYECKASTQERPYAARPSRTQQLRNPKLVPKLTNEALKPLDKKKGLADEELAKREAARAKKQESEELDDLDARPKKRPRSISPDSVSTISTDISRDSRQTRTRRRQSSPTALYKDKKHPHGHANRSPSPRRQMLRSPTPRMRQRCDSSGSSSDARQTSTRRKLSSASMRRNSRTHSQTSPTQRSRLRSPRRDSRSPRPERHTRPSRGRNSLPGRSNDSNDDGSREIPISDDYKDTRMPRPRRQMYSRSPDPNARRYGNHGKEPRYTPPRSRFEQPSPSERGRQGPRDGVDEPPRERSLSPFSKRLAMTKAINGGML